MTNTIQNDQLSNGDAPIQDWQKIAKAAHREKKKMQRLALFAVLGVGVSVIACLAAVSTLNQPPKIVTKTEYVPVEKTVEKIVDNTTPVNLDALRRVIVSVTEELAAPYKDQKSVAIKVDIPKIMQIKATSFASLKGWDKDQHKIAAETFYRSCAKITTAKNLNVSEKLKDPLTDETRISLAGKSSDWTSICGDLKSKRQQADWDNAKAKAFFETNFTPLQITRRDEKEDKKTKAKTYSMTRQGLFTGYYEPVYPASMTKTAKFSVPVLTKPDDHVVVNLGRFRTKYKGEIITGRMVGKDFVPYADHEEIIEKGVKAKTIAWMDPNDLFFLQIQGSGALEIGEGSNKTRMRVGYADKNGRAYTAIGRELIQKNIIPREKMSMKAIRDWLETADPAKAAALRYSNKSYVFFRELKSLPEPDLGAYGSGGVQLTTDRSLAVDRAFYMMGTPIWVDLYTNQNHDDTSNEIFSKLMIAQDTGGAIKGVVRGDIYFGIGDEAGTKAGTQKAHGEMTILLPKQLARRVLAAQTP